MFNNYSDLEQVKQVIANKQLVFIYIGQQNCGVCHSLKPQVAKIVAKYPEIEMIELDAQHTPEVASMFQVLTVPVLLLFVDGREYLRRARIVQTREFAAELEKIVSGVRSITEGERLDVTSSSSS